MVNAKIGQKHAGFMQMLPHLPYLEPLMCADAFLTVIQRIQEILLQVLHHIPFKTNMQGADELPLSS